MPYFNFATYADYREEWAIEAQSLEDARRRIGTDPDGGWLQNAFHLDADCVERRDEFVTEENGETPVIEEITPGHWAYRNAHRGWIERSVLQNTAAIAAELHGHRDFDEFYRLLGPKTGGFVGIYDLSIAMADALTEWEVANGLGAAYDNHRVSWIEVVEDFVGDTILGALTSAEVPDFAAILEGLQVLRPPSGT